MRHASRCPPASSARSDASAPRTCPDASMAAFRARIFAMPFVVAATASGMTSGTATKASPGWCAGSGALYAVWRTVTASPRAWSALARCSIGLRWPWDGSGNSTTRAPRAGVGPSPSAIVVVRVAGRLKVPCCLGLWDASRFSVLQLQSGYILYNIINSAKAYLSISICILIF
uniref:Uncharacterized protein n=1 Tax=Zea mays TaxID=4577 RepID=B8A264_MAIZE|nr:unknown [Zea mays]